MILYLGDAKERLERIRPNSIDAVVTDPPYGLSFMGKKWDYDVPTTELWREVFRVLKPGGHLLAFFGTRTYHRGVVRIEDAGFEIRDQIQWIYGSGFPKSHNLKDEWQGWGTALKPANEPIVLARKPLEKGLTVAENVLKWGTGAINVDATRIEFGANEPDKRIGTDAIAKGASKNPFESGNSDYENPMYKQGRWPANVILDEAAAATLPIDSQGHSVSRYFYVAKASKRERNAGLEGMPLREIYPQNNSIERRELNSTSSKRVQNHHPTVKPIKLMEYLCKLVTPPNGVVLDPFMGSGSTGVAAKHLGFKFVGIELNKEYFEIAKRRIEYG